MWKRIAIGSEAGQATGESALLLAALTLGAMGLSWPVARRLLEAWRLHEETVRAIVDFPLP